MDAGAHQGDTDVGGSGIDRMAGGMDALDDHLDTEPVAPLTFSLGGRDVGIDCGAGAEDRDDVAAALPDLAAGLGKQAEQVDGILHGLCLSEQVGEARLLVHQVDEPGQHAGLGAEVGVEGLGRDARLGGDQPDRGAGIAVFGEQAARRGEDRAQGERLTSIMKLVVFGANGPPAAC